MTQRKKPIFLIVIPAAVVLLFAAGLLWLWLRQGATTETPFSIVRAKNSNEIVSCQLQVGLEQGQEQERPLPFYNFDLPEGWDHSQNAAQTANRLSVTYEDYYLDESKNTIAFLQRYAVQQYDFMNAAWGVPEHIQEVRFGQRQMIFAQWDSVGGTVSALYWVQEDSLLCLRYGADRDMNQMLELAGRVEQTPTRQPEYFPPRIQRSSISYGDYEELPITTGYCAVGNPEIPQDLNSLTFPTFLSAPEGYALVEMEKNLSEDNLSPWAWEYENQQGNTLRLTTAYGSMDFFTDLNAFDPKAFHGIPHDQLGDTSLVQDAQVGSNPALIYLGEGESSIGWVNGNYSLQLRSTAPITAEELIALAETVG